MIELHNDDCLKILKDMPDNSVTAIVTDPPYGLSKQPDISEVMKHWVNEDYKDVNSSAGFMGKKWDSFVPSPEIWKEVYRVLKPGGTALVFAGTRTQDLMAISLRFAGFHIKDTLMFIFGTGFPKAADIAKNIDKKLGNEREVVERPRKDQRPNADKVRAEEGKVGKFGMSDNKYMTVGNTEWEGHKSHSLKPAYEPILLAMKPNDGSYADNALKHGVAGLNVDGSRVGTSGSRTNSNGKRSMYGGNSLYESKTHNDKTVIHNKGRFPANIIHDGSESVVECFPDTKSGNKIKIGGTPRKTEGFVCTGSPDRSNALMNYGDSSSASRYFKTCLILDEDIETQRIFYTAKASKKERNEGLDGFEKKYQANAKFRPNHMEKAIKGDSGKPHGRYTKTKNNHPTVKPKKLMEYLVGLVKMPENTVVLDPFMGSGTTGIACVNNDVDFIGIELEPEYFEIAKARIEHVKEVKE